MYIYDIKYRWYHTCGTQKSFVSDNQKHRKQKQSNWIAFDINIKGLGLQIFCKNRLNCRFCQSKMRSVIATITIVYFCALVCQSQRLYTLKLDQAILVNSSYVPGYLNTTTFRVAKLNRTTFVVNEEYESFFDWDETVFIEIEAYVSRLNNNQYTKSPLRIPKMNLCQFLSGPYQKYIMEDLKGVSNLPQTAAECSCPLKKVSHSIIELNKF